METKKASTKKAQVPKTATSKFEVRHYKLITDLFQKATKETANRFITLEQITKELGDYSGSVFDKLGVKVGLLWLGFKPVKVQNVDVYAVIDKNFDSTKKSTIINFTPLEKEAMSDFLSFYTFEEVQNDLLAIQIRSLASNDSDSLTPLQRANELCLYKHLTSVLKPLFNQKEAIMAIN